MISCHERHLKCSSTFGGAKKCCCKCLPSSMVKVSMAWSHVNHVMNKHPVLMRTSTDKLISFQSSWLHLFLPFPSLSNSKLTLPLIQICDSFQWYCESVGTFLSHHLKEEYVSKFGWLYTFGLLLLDIAMCHFHACLAFVHVPMLCWNLTFPNREIQSFCLGGLFSNFRHS